jgi:nitroimidazol reductase NimA-like FMN-containing flavoprotein (pyridoxamine 5'-phosphate oxidase superfamily)
MTLGSMTAAEIDELLARATMARLACQGEDRPYVVPVAYAYRDGAVLVHSFLGTKVAMMRKNPRVCIQLDEIEHMASWRSVVAWGTFEELEGERAEAALRTLVERLLPPGAAAERRDPFAPPGMEDQVVLFQVKLDEKSGRFARP